MFRSIVEQLDSSDSMGLVPRPNTLSKAAICFVFLYVGLGCEGELELGVGLTPHIGYLCQMAVTNAYVHMR